MRRQVTWQKEIPEVTQLNWSDYGALGRGCREAEQHHGAGAVSLTLHLGVVIAAGRTPWRQNHSAVGTCLGCHGSWYEIHLQMTESKRRLREQVQLLNWKVGWRHEDDSVMTYVSLAFCRGLRVWPLSRLSLPPWPFGLDVLPACSHVPTLDIFWFLLTIPFFIMLPLVITFLSTLPAEGLLTSLIVMEEFLTLRTEPVKLG